MPIFNKRNNNKKGVIFDLDDTLAKTKIGKNSGLKVVSSRIYNYLTKKKIRIRPDGLYKKILITTQQMDMEGIYNRNYWWDCVIRKFLRKKPIKSFLEELTKIYWDCVIKKSQLYNDTVSILTYLKNKGYLLGLLTDTDGKKGVKSERIKKLNLKNWFNSIVVAGEDVRQTKPDNAPFFLIARKLNLKPRECVFVGNNLYVDILGAKKTGMATVLIKRDGCKAKIKPDRVIHTLIELKKILL